MKIFKFVASLLVLTLLFCSCQGKPAEITTEPKATETETTADPMANKEVRLITNYNLLSGGIAAGSPGTMSDKDTFRLGYYDLVEKTDVPDKKAMVFGYECELLYGNTQSMACAKDIDRYDAINRAESAFYDVWYQGDVMVKCIRNQFVKDSEFRSEVNPGSDEKEFLAYARKIILEVTGISTENWEAKSLTKVSGSTHFEVGFINQSAENPDLEADYSFIFTQPISGIETNNQIKIHMTSNGEVYLLDALEAKRYEELYAPFTDVQIDKDAMLASVTSDFESNTMSYEVTGHSIKMKAIPTTDALWVEATVTYHYRGTGDVILGSGIRYYARVAEIVEVTK